MTTKNRTYAKGKPEAAKTTAAELTAAVRGAEKLARKAHAGQTDLAGKPYIKHVQRVAKAAARYGPAAAAAAWLHDTVEDTTVGPDQIAERFPPEIATLVWHLTRADTETYTGYISRMVSNKNATAILIKLADLRDHAEVTPETLNAGLARRYDLAYQELTRKNQAVRKQLEPDELHSPFTRIVEIHEARRIAENENPGPRKPTRVKKKPDDQTTVGEGPVDGP